MSDGGPEILDVVLGNLMGVGAEGREHQPVEHGLEGEGVDGDVVEDEFALGERGKVVVDPREERVTAEFPRVAAGVEAESLGQVQAVLSCAPGKNRGPSETVNYGGDTGERVSRVAARALQI